VPKDNGPAEDAALLVNVLGLEYEAIAAYATVLEADRLAAAELDLARGFQEDHRKHAEALKRLIDRLGGTPVEAATPEAYGFSAAQLTRREDALGFLIGFEQGLALAHLAGISAFADREVAKGAGGLVGIEAMHWAVWREALGEKPTPAPFLG
jgi:Ferritin-like domain